MSRMYYKLIDKEPIQISAEELAKRNEPTTPIQQDVVEEYYISTVFLSVPDYPPNSIMATNPLFFETTVFDDKARQNGDYLDIEKRQYHTFDEAEKGHREIIQKYKQQNSS